MNSNLLAELRALPMMAGRARMVDVLVAAGDAGVTMDDLVNAYYADGPKPLVPKKSAACQVQRLRSQAESVGLILTSNPYGGGRASMFKLIAPAPVAKPATVVQGPPPAERLFGIRATVGWGGVSVARSAFLEGARA